MLFNARSSCCRETNRILCHLAGAECSAWIFYIFAGTVIKMLLCCDDDCVHHLSSSALQTKRICCSKLTCNTNSGAAFTVSVRQKWGQRVHKQLAKQAAVCVRMKNHRWLRCLYQHVNRLCSLIWSLAAGQIIAELLLFSYLSIIQGTFKTTSFDYLWKKNW